MRINREYPLPRPENIYIPEKPRLIKRTAKRCGKDIYIPWDAGCMILPTVPTIKPETMRERARRLYKDNPLKFISELMTGFVIATALLVNLCVILAVAVRL